MMKLAEAGAEVNTCETKMAENTDNINDNKAKGCLWKYIDDSISIFISFDSKYIILFSTVAIT